MDPTFRPNRLQRLLCSDCFDPSKLSARPDTTATKSSLPSESPDPEGVAALLAIATGAMNDERDRGRALDAKTVSIAGFSGLILSLNGAIAKPLFDEQLGSAGGIVARACFFASIAALLAAALLAIVGVLMPQRYRGVGRAQIRSFYTLEMQSKSGTEVRQSMLGAIAHIVDQDRPVNDCKARITKLVAGFLALGFLALAGEALTLGARQIGM
jgi:hypothetical protein